MPRNGGPSSLTLGRPTLRRPAFRIGAKRGDSMSRAYRIRVKESLKRDLKAEDSLRTQIEMLVIRPSEQMREMRARELEQRGFESQEDGTMSRKGRNGVCVTVQPASGEVTIRAEAAYS